MPWEDMTDAKTEKTEEAINKALAKEADAHKSKLEKEKKDKKPTSIEELAVQENDLLKQKKDAIAKEDYDTADKLTQQIKALHEDPKAALEKQKADAEKREDWSSSQALQ